MLNFIKSLLNESSKMSMTRALSALCVLTAISIAIYAMIKGINLDSTIGLCSTFLGFGLGAKVIQKNMESKTEVQVESSDKG